MKHTSSFLSIIIILASMFAVSQPSNPYHEIQILNQSSHYGVSIDVSDYNQFLAVSNNDENIYIYKEKNTTGFEIHQILNDSSDDVETVDITGDGQYILGIAYNRKALLYHYENSTEQFEIFQTINLSTNTSHYCHGGAITDDHQWMVAGVSNKLEVFTFNESINEFTLNETINDITGNVKHISLTNDHSFMAVSTERDYVYIYKYNGSSFVKSQTFQFDSKNPERAFLSDDHQHLIMSEDVQSWLFGIMCTVYMYEYNITSGKFESVRSLTITGTYSNYVSLSRDKYFMTVSGSESTKVQSDVFESGINIQHTFAATRYHKFSQNMKYLVTSYHSVVRVYELDCNWNVTGGYLLNEEEGVCQMCSQGCNSCYNLTYCGYCDEQRSYARNTSTDECELCQDNNFIENNTCFSCIDNCLTCSNGHQCEDCEQGYYLDDSKTCSECQQNCLHCSTYDHCEECNQSQGYARNDSTGNCVICDEGHYTENHICSSCSDNCLSCANSSECQACEKGWYIDENNDCSQCEDNCLDCSNERQCVECDENFDLSFGNCLNCGKEEFIQNGSCVSCSIENCEHCSNLEQCSECEDGFEINDEKTCDEIAEEKTNLIRYISQMNPFAAGAIGFTLGLIVTSIISYFVVKKCFMKRIQNSNQNDVQPNNEKIKFHVDEQISTQSYGNDKTQIEFKVISQKDP